jgi:sugar-specific transcriptional regulator TrmB
MQDTSLLEKLGFSKNEASIYTALLTLGKAGVSDITRKAGMNRTTGYAILHNLVGRGFVSVTGKEPQQEYAAESPDTIVQRLRKEVAYKQEQLRTAEALVPELKSMHNIADRPRVRFYEGKEGLKQVYEDTLTSHEPIVSYATFDDMHKALPDYFPLYYKRRAKKGIDIRGIVPKTEAAVMRSRLNKDERREMTFVPADEYYFSPEIDIYDNKVMIASWREKLGIIIESQEIADAMKKIFKLSWIGAKQIEV